MLRGVSPTAMKRAASYFKRVRVTSGSLRKFQPGLMLDNVEDMVDWEDQGVKVMELSAFAVFGGACFLRARAQCPLTRFPSCHTKSSHGHCGTATLDHIFLSLARRLVGV